MDNLSVEPQLENQILQKIRVRCPECFKQYAVELGSIQSSRPKFACKNCKSQFWIPFPECLEQDEILGFRNEWLDNAPSVNSADAPQDNVPKSTQSLQVSQFQCPKCKFDNPVGSKECGKCEVVFEKLFNPEIKTKVPASKLLKQKWDDIKLNYENPSLHFEFIASCEFENNLQYASFVYGKILEAIPNEEIAEKMRKHIVERLNVKMLSQKSKFNSKRRKFPFIWLVVTVCMGLIIFGYLLPEYRNLVGLGVSMLFITGAIRYSLKWMS